MLRYQLTYFVAGQNLVSVPGGVHIKVRINVDMSGPCQYLGSEILS